MTIKLLKDKQMEQPNKVKAIEMKEASHAYKILRGVALQDEYDECLGLYRYRGKEKNSEEAVLYSEDAGDKPMEVPRGLDNLVLELISYHNSSKVHYIVGEKGESIPTKEVSLRSIFKFIKSKEQRRLLNLLDSFSEVWDCWEKDNLKFKVNGIKSSSLVPSGKSISFVDNINGLTSYFAPTMEYIDKVAKEVGDDPFMEEPFRRKAYGLEHIMRLGVCGYHLRTKDKVEVYSDVCSKPQSNSVVYNWYMGGWFSSWHEDPNKNSDAIPDKEYAGSAYAFKPFITLSPKGYEIHVRNKKEVEKGISAFKERFKTTYIPCAYSPIILNVRSILEESYGSYENLLKKEKDDSAERKRLGELDLVNEKEF